MRQLFQHQLLLHALDAPDAAITNTEFLCNNRVYLIFRMRLRERGWTLPKAGKESRNL